jgi:hypothetical protein
MIAGFVAPLTLLAAVPCLLNAQAGPPTLSGTDFPGAKSGATAFAWSFLGTALPLGAALALSSDDVNGQVVAGFTMVGALVLGPSLGHFYAGRSGRALTGIGLRTLALAGLTAGAAATWNGDSDAGSAAAYAGVALGGALVLWDIVRAPHSAKIRNEQRRRSASVTPTLSPGDAGVRLGARITC